MRSRFKMPFSALLKGQRQWEKMLTKAVKASTKALALSPLVAKTRPVAKSRAAAKPKTAAKATSAKAAGVRLREVVDFGSNPGRLRMMCYAPPSLLKQAPLVVVLHGCHQTAEGYDRCSGWTALARERGFAVVYAEQTRSNNGNLCFNWFRPSNVTRDRGEVMSIRQMIETMVALHGIDHRRIYVTGLSAGGAMTAAMLATYPDLFAGGAVIAGLPFGAARDVRRALEVMRTAPQRSGAEWGNLVRDASPVRGDFPTVSVWHGTRDQTVSISNSEALVHQWLDVHGLSAGDYSDSMVDGHVRRVWKDRDGRVAVEFYRIEGMGHGTPLKPGAGRSAETAGPYMLDAGISSCTQLATLWDLQKPPLRPVVKAASK